MNGRVPRKGNEPQRCAVDCRQETIPGAILETAQIIGYLAAICSTVSFTPQAWKIITTRHTKDISGRMYTLTVTGFSLWTGYGVMLGEWPIVLANSLCLFLSGFILTMKLLPQRKKEKVAKAVRGKR